MYGFIYRNMPARKTSESHYFDRFAFDCAGCVAFASDAHGKRNTEFFHYPYYYRIKPWVKRRGRRLGFRFDIRMETCFNIDNREYINGNNIDFPIKKRCGMVFPAYPFCSFCQDSDNDRFDRIVGAAYFRPGFGDDGRTKGQVHPIEKESCTQDQIPCFPVIGADVYACGGNSVCNGIQVLFGRSNRISFQDFPYGLVFITFFFIYVCNGDYNLTYILLCLRRPGGFFEKTAPWTPEKLFIYFAFFLLVYSTITTKNRC
jgi:hypothetical protein